jgi:DNA-binding NarL/FixJ family response regulator
MASTTSSRPRILIADSHDVALNGLFRILAKNGCDVREARTNEELLSKLKVPLPDLLIIDYASLKECTPDDLIALRQQFDTLQLMVITSHRDKKTIIRILESGIHGFLFKDCTEQEFVRCVEAMLRGERFFCNDVFDILMETRLARPESQWPSHLTTREVDIIKLIVKGYSTSLIAGELNLSPHTISTHRKNIIRKLKIKSPVELVAQAYDLGLVSRDDTQV